MKRLFENIEFPSVREVWKNIFMVFVTCSLTFVIVKIITLGLNELVYALVL